MDNQALIEGLMEKVFAINSFIFFNFLAFALVLGYGMLQADEWLIAASLGFMMSGFSLIVYKVVISQFEGGNTGVAGKTADKVVPNAMQQRKNEVLTAVET